MEPSACLGALINGHNLLGTQISFIQHMEPFFSYSPGSTPPPSVNDSIEIAHPFITLPGGCWWLVRPSSVHAEELMKLSPEVVSWIVCVYIDDD